MTIFWINPFIYGKMVDVAFGHSVSPYLTVYPWNVGGGFGTKYSDPPTKPPGDCYHTRFSATGRYLVTGSGTAPYVAAYNWTLGGGFGTKFADPGTAVAGSVGRGVNWNWTETALGIATMNASPWINAYAWSSSGFGTKYAAPAVSPGGNAYMCEWSRSGGYVHWAHFTGSGISGYPWSDSTGFGTKLSNPTTAGDTGFGISVAGDDATVFLSTATTVAPYVHAYNWTGSAYGTKYANPSSVGTGGSTDNQSIPAQPSTPTTVGFGQLGGTFQTVYSWSNASGFGTKFSDPATAVDGPARAISWTPGGEDIIYGTGTSPWVSAYKWSSGYGTKYATPATTPTGIVRGGHFSY